MNDRLSERNRVHPFQLPTWEQPFVSYRFLDALFKVMGQVDYRALPAQSSQGIMKVVFQNWTSFFAGMRDYRKHPEKYLGKPNIPGYARSAVKELVFSNQDCVIKERKYLKFPKTRLQLNVGKLGCANGQLKQVRVVPSHGQCVVELVFACPIEKRTASLENTMAIDLGVDNLATIVTTTGSQPIVVKGKIVKAITGLISEC